MIDSGNWLHMGDLGCMDERGFIKITGRLKDMIIRGGINIYPREIEELLQTHPAVAEVAVVGVQDQKWGEQLAAVIRLNPVDERPSERVAGLLPGADVGAQDARVLELRPGHARHAHRQGSEVRPPGPALRGRTPPHRVGLGSAHRGRFRIRCGRAAPMSRGLARSVQAR